MTVIEYQEYRPNQLRSRMEPILEPGRDEIIGYAGLASHHIPRSVLLTPTPTGGLTVELVYPEYEKPDDRSFPLGNTGITLRLGRYSRRVQEIHAKDLRHFLMAQSGRLDLAEVERIAESYPSRLAKILTRSAALISEILETMPDRYQRLVLRASDHDRLMEESKKR